ncbi:MAG: tetratricopeptide repeat protein [Bacteroidia bacterium]
MCGDDLLWLPRPKKYKGEKAGIIKTVYFFFLLLSFGNALVQAQRIRKLIEEGDRLEKMQRYEEALQKYEEARMLNPSGAIVYLRKGHVLAALGRNEEALRNYELAAQLYPSLPGTYTGMANIYLQQRNYDKAIEAYNQGYQRVHEVGQRSRFKLQAICLMAFQGRRQEALTELASFKRYIPISAAYLEVLFGEGQLHLTLNNLQEAMAAFQRGYEATQQHPAASAPFLFGLALAHYKAGNRAEYERYAELIQDPPYRQCLERAVAQSGAAYEPIPIPEFYPTINDEDCCAGEYD